MMCQGILNKVESCTKNTNPKEGERLTANSNLEVLMVIFSHLLEAPQKSRTPTRPKACRRDPLVESLPTGFGHRPASNYSHQCGTSCDGRMAQSPRIILVILNDSRLGSHGVIFRATVGPA